jgi:selenocysteine-specific elongation factor
MSAPLAVVVIGHVDHGKTALVRALTGIETDRLKEEIARGLSITLGFAWRDYASSRVDLIDAPGHEDFVRAMVAGATGSRAALLVVSAVEGFGRQTFEHLQIAHALGVRTGVVAVSKADLLAPGAEAQVRAEVEATLSRGFLARAPVVFCSAVSGRGIAALQAELESLGARAAPPPPLPGAFLPIDRAFTITGAGAVVTGTLQGRPLRTGAEAVLLPSGRRVAIRQLQVHGNAVDQAQPGGRVAVNLRGVAAADITPGETLSDPDAFAASGQVDVEVAVAAESSRSLRHLDEVRVLWGARTDMASLRLIGAKSLAPGDRGLAQLRFSGPVIAHAGQRAVLRRPSPAATVAGVIVLDPIAKPLRGKDTQRSAVLKATVAGDLGQIVDGLAQRDRGVVSIAEAARLWRRPPAEALGRLDATYEAVDDGHVVSRASLALARRAYLDGLTQAHRLAPIKAWADVGPLRNAVAGIASSEVVIQVEKSLLGDGVIRLAGSNVALADHDPIAALCRDALGRLGEIEAALRGGGLTPPETTSLRLAGPLDEDLLALIIDTGRAIALRNVSLRQTLVFHREALEEGARRLLAFFAPPTAFSTGEARAALATTRKFIVPVLEYFDAIGVTERTGDVRRMKTASRFAAGGPTVAV